MWHWICGLCGCVVGRYMVVEYCVHVMESKSLCGIPCLCTLSASAFIKTSLHQLDFNLLQKLFDRNYSGHYAR